MKDSKLPFDCGCHVLYSKACKKQIQSKIALHYPETKREAVWERVQRQYAAFLTDWRTDLGGSKNFHNGAGGTYDCIAIMSYYAVCRDVVSFREIEEIEENLILPNFRKLSKFVDCNRPFFKKLMYRAFQNAEKRCAKWHDYEMRVAPFEKDKPIYYEFTACPAAEFARKHGLTDIMPPCATWILRPWSCSTPAWCERGPAWTAAGATTSSAATAIRICATIPNTGMRRDTGETAEEKGEKPTMKFMVFGAGVLGCNLANNLFRAGKNVTLLARGIWAEEIRRNGLRIKNSISRRTAVSRIPVVEELSPEDDYDVIFAAVRYTQIETILEALRASRAKTMIFVGNNVRASETAALLPGKNVLFAFTSAAGHRESNYVDSVDLRKITIGPLRGAPSQERLIQEIFAGTKH